MTQILTVTLNPAVDLTTTADHIMPGPKLRCDPPVIEPSGGGVNVSRMIRLLGGHSTAFVAIAGATGELIRTLLAHEALDCVFIEASGDTRMSFAVHERGTSEQYRFVLPGPAQDEAFAVRVVERFEALLRDKRYACVVGSGSLPPGVAEDFYARLAEISAHHGADFVLDASGPALIGGLGPHVAVVKPNEIEARTLAESLGLAPDDPAALGRHLVAERKTRAAVLTLGDEGALLVTEAGVRHVKPPTVPVVSKVGAGDSFVGAMVHGIASGMAIEQAFALGVSAAAAAVMTPSTELARRGDVEWIYAGLSAD